MTLFPVVSRKLTLSAALLAIVCVSAAAQTATKTSSAAKQVPTFRVDPTWPKPLPTGWKLGPVCGVSVDSHGNIWIIHRSGVDLSPTRSATPPQPDQSQAPQQKAPDVLEFTPDGTLLASWGGPGPGYDWPHDVHGIFVDAHDNVWIGGAGHTDSQILKFTKQGKFLLQIGHPGKNSGSNDTENLGAPAGFVVDEAAHEIYVADGYVNHRVIVFDSNTGAYKRHWGAYGKRPDDSYYTALGIQPGQHTMNGSVEVPKGPPPPQFDLVHSVRISNDGLVYVCDRTHNRIQVFRKDGTYLKEAFIANDILASGSTSDIGFSTDPEQRYAFVLDSTKDQAYVLDRNSLKVLSTFGAEGHLPGQFTIPHNIAVDSNESLYVTETLGMRVQKFVLAGNQKPN